MSGVPFNYRDATSAAATSLHEYRHCLACAVGMVMEGHDDSDPVVSISIKGSHGEFAPLLDLPRSKSERLGALVAVGPVASLGREAILQFARKSDYEGLYEAGGLSDPDVELATKWPDSPNPR